MGMLQFPSAWQSEAFGGIPVMYVVELGVSIVHNVGSQSAVVKSVYKNIGVSSRHQVR